MEASNFLGTWGRNALIWQTKTEFAYWWLNLVLMDTTGEPK